MNSGWLTWFAFGAASLALCAGPGPHRRVLRALYAAAVGVVLYITLGPVGALLILAGALLVSDAWHWHP